MSNPDPKSTSTLLTAGGPPDPESLTPWKFFLESTPPGKEVLVRDMTVQSAGRSDQIATPELNLHCTHENCRGIRYFAATEGGPFFNGQTRNIYLEYVCRNCRRHTKTFSLQVSLDSAVLAYKAVKYGERPSFGTPTPARTISLIGPDRELFLAGRKCENQGMGIGAFVYYRRVVENQKNRIFDEIIRVMNKVSPNPELLAELEQAKQETQFSKSIEKIKHALPQILFINGYNPLTLLHSALSEGLHAQTDDQCLELATSIRILLTEFSERSAQALKDEHALNNAISRLLHPKNVGPG